MTRQRFEEVTLAGGWGNLSDRAKWELRGEDRVRYLNGQVTQDVRKAATDQAVYACVTDVKGRICGDVFVSVSDGGEALQVDAEASLAEDLGLRLERYIIADDVEMTEVTGAKALWHVFGKAAEGVLGIRSNRIGVDGVDLWLPADATPPAASGVLTSEEWDVMRVVNGIPKWPNELNSATFPPEAGLEERAMDFAKGCYIGQEILSRIRTTRKMPRRLIQWEAASAGKTISAGEEIANAEGKAVGEVSSVVTHPVSGVQVGLGYVKQATSLDSELLVGSGMASIRASSQLS